MKELHELREKLCNELKSYGNKDMTAGSLDVIDKLAHAVKNIDKIIHGDTMEYSTRHYARGYYPDSNYHDRYSYHGNMVHELKELMDDTHNEEIRQDIKRLINKVENM